MLTFIDRKLNIHAMRIGPGKHLQGMGLAIHWAKHSHPFRPRVDEWLG
jgi:hypothetical protein